MIKFYGMPSCLYCDFIEEQINGWENRSEYNAKGAATGSTFY